MKTLIVPDIHNCIDKVDKIINYESADRIVFLGDFFDDFGDDYRIALETAEWLAASLEQSNRIHLFGNHDVSYAFKNNSYKCSGYDQGKDFAINSVLKEEHWRKLHLYTYVGKYLCSHAGVHTRMYQLYSKGRSLNKFLQDECKIALNDAFEGNPPRPILEAGRSRGGNAAVGGIIWCDSSEFVGIHGVHQIFGHTPSKKPFWKNFGDPEDKIYSSNLALDNFGHSNYYAIHQNDVVNIKWIEDM